VTGLGSTTVLAGVVKSPETRVTVTGTVAGWYLGSVKVTLKPPSVVIGREQGVVQVGPSDVFASAPGGVDSNWTVTGSGADLNESRENEEQPARLRPAAANTITRRMVCPLLSRLAAVPVLTIEASPI
jgi:hypothetical protein